MRQAGKTTDSQPNSKKKTNFSLLFLREYAVLDHMAIMQYSFLPLNPEARTMRGTLEKLRSIPGQDERVIMWGWESREHIQDYFLK